MAEALTDNKKRTALAVRNLCKRHGAEMVDGGAVSFMFETRGRILVDLAAPRGGAAPPPTPAAALDDLFSAATDADAADVQPLEGAAQPQAVVWTAVPRLHAVAKALSADGWRLAESGVVREANVTVGVPEEEEEAVFTFLRELEELPEIHAVYSNAV